ncbi:MAG: AbiEi antitoxin N-terminal domain-containing protein [Candidatus Thiodiazotropha sp. LLP2]
MNAGRGSKLNTLLSTQPLGTVLSSAWLVEQGYSLDLQKQYKKSQWFDSIGTGALIRHGDQVDYLGGIYALQSQLGLFDLGSGKRAIVSDGVYVSKYQITVPRELEAEA